MNIKPDASQFNLRASFLYLTTMIKRTVGDFLSLVVGNNDEDYEPTKSEYWMFAIFVFIIVLTSGFIFY